MPTDLHLIRASEFVHLDADKHPDIEKSKKRLMNLVYACRKRGVDRAMLDLRGLPMPSKPYFSPKEIAGLVESFHEAGFTKKQRLAVLYEWDNYGGVRNFTFFSRMHGMQVQAFHEFERAIYWLSGEQDALASSPPGIPISVRRSKTNTARLTRTRTVLPQSVLKATRR